MSAKEALKLLSVRNGMRTDRYFVGRRQELSSLESRLTRPFDPVWIHGPHRIGKSALAWMGARIAERQGAHVIEADAIECRTLDQAIQVVLDAAQRRNLDISGARPRDALRSLARKLEETGLVVVFDEFDAVAINLQTDEQAFLRKLVSEEHGLGFVFVTSSPPTVVMEEVSDVASRLSQVCKVHAVFPLEQRDVVDLCEKVAIDMDCQALRALPDDIWLRVGGFTMATVAYLEALARRIECGEEIDEFVLDETLDELDTDVIPHFHRYFGRLSLQSRLVAAGRLPPDVAMRELKRDRLWDRQGFRDYRLLREVARRDSAVHAVDSEEPDAHRALRLVADINDALLLQKKQVAFRASSSALRVFRLSREPVTETVFADSIDYLYKTFFELARRRGSEIGPEAYRLPLPLAKRYSSAHVVGTISDLRNYLFHDHARPNDEDRVNDNYRRAGDRFKAYCGKRTPSDNQDRKKVRDGILRELADLLTAIRDDLLSELPT